ncbi:MAG: ROK family protein [Erysipelotrichaceae bacterium]|nr:ROK family protein [Erysipelotrichaceae bacterium]
MYAVGVDIGGMSMKCGLVNEKGEVVDRVIVKTTLGDPYEKTIGELCDGIKELLKKNYLSPNDINGVGIGVPGAVNIKKGTVDSSANLKWYNVPLVELVTQGVGRQARITNDANAAVLGEARFGFKWKYPNVVMLTLGTGVGGGLIVDGRLYEGNEGKGAELGHVTLVLDGRQCGCGRRGCAEQYASATALMRLTREAMEDHKESLMWQLCDNDINNVNGAIPFAAEKQGDPAAKQVVDEYIKYLGETILNFNNIFRPNAFILSGGVAKQGENLINKLKDYCAKQNWGYENTPEPELLIAQLGYDSGIIGAASLYL